MTESEAKEKCCPMLLGNSNRDPHYATCEGQQCMMWIWHNNSKEYGFCGLCFHAGILQKVRKKENTGAIPSFTTTGQSIADEFNNEFWPGVPRTCRKDKKRTLPMYRNARKTTGKETILAGLPGYRAKEKRRADKIDYQAHSPFRWLRDECWTDEVGVQSAKPVALCKCGCGQPGQIIVGTSSYATTQCRIKIEGW